MTTASGEASPTARIRAVSREQLEEWVMCAEMEAGHHKMKRGEAEKKNKRLREALGEIVDEGCRPGCDWGTMYQIAEKALQGKGDGE